MSEVAATSTTATEGAAAATAGGEAAQGAAAAQTTTATLLTGGTATGGEATATQVADDKAAAEAKAKADAEAAAKAKPEGAPEKYEAFTLAEGIDAKPEDVAAFGEVARKLNLTQAQAQELVDYQTKFVQAQMEAQRTADAETIKGWRDASSADKEFGGAGLTANMALASRALQKFGTPELTEFFTKTTRLGDHPEVLRFFVRVGKALGEDQHIQGGVTAPAKTAAQRLFDKSNHN